MQKNALPITVTTLVIGVFGAFLRWLQNMNIYEESGLAVRGAGTSIAFLVYSAAAAAVMIGVVLLWLRRYARSTEAGTALRTSTSAAAAAAWVLCAVFVCAAMVLLFRADQGRYPMFRRIFAAAAIVGGLCIPFIPGRRGSGEPSAMGGAASVYVTLFFCFWLVFSYKTNAESPVVWSYGPEILAVAASTLGIYYVAAYFYNRAKPNAAMIFVQLAAYLDICVLSDARDAALNVMLGTTAAVMLMFEFILIENLREDPDRA